MIDAPCNNPNCPSYGKPHPNCRCYASGGMVCGSPHKMNCEFHVEQKVPFFADGGTVHDGKNVLEHHVVHSGFHGLLTKSGKTNLNNPDSHRETVGKLKQHLINNDHDGATELLHQSPLSGGTPKASLKPILQSMAGPVVNSEAHPENLRAGIEYLHAAQKGEGRIKEHSSNIFEKQSKRIMDHEKLGSLKKELARLQMQPSKILDIADGVGHMVPNQSAQIGAHVANAVGYLNSIKPMNSQGGPLDKVMKPSKLQEYRYNKALDIAEDPLSVIHHAKDGTLEAQDLVTLNTLYPKVAQSIMQQATETLFERKDRLTIKEKRGLSALLGAPLMLSQTPEACQAIMRANAGAETQENQNQPKKKNKEKATSAELKQINKVNEMYATPLQDRQMDKNTD